MARKSTRSLWTNKILNPTSSSCITKSPASKRADDFASLLERKQPFLGKILGIDPSLRGTGLAIVEFRKDKKIHLLKTEIIQLNCEFEMPECLGAIYQRIIYFLQDSPVDVAAFEQTIYVQNFQIAQILGAARGAAMAAAANQGLPIFEYPPLRIKQAVVGIGRASKQQVSRTVGQLLGCLDHTQTLSSDETDAAAVAICHGLTWTRTEGSIKS